MTNMRFDLVLFVILFQYSFLHLTKSDFIQNNSSIIIELNECASINRSIDSINSKQINTCDIDCCTENQSISSNLCEVTISSAAGDCLSRFCYSNRCDELTFLVNKTSNKQNQMKTILNRIRSSFSDIRWSSLLNKTETRLFSIIDQTSLTERHRFLMILVCLNIILTLMTLIIVFKSIRQANLIAQDKSYRFALL